MELSNRIKRTKARAGSLPGQMSRREEPAGEAVPTGAGETFDNWLDDQLQALYRTVLNEPLPPEILDLLSRPKDGSRE